MLRASTSPSAPPPAEPRPFQRSSRCASVALAARPRASARPPSGRICAGWEGREGKLRQRLATCRRVVQKSRSGTQRGTPPAMPGSAPSGPPGSIPGPAAAACGRTRAARQTRRRYCCLGEGRAGGRAVRQSATCRRRRREWQAQQTEAQQTAAPISTNRPRTQLVVRERQCAQPPVAGPERGRDLLAAALGDGAAIEDEALEELAGRLVGVQQLQGGSVRRRG
jgi:hypothetical protein